MDKFIHRKRNFLNTEESEKLISIFETHVDEHGKPNPRGYIGIEASFGDTYVPFFAEIVHLLIEECDVYAKKHPFMNKLKWGIDDIFMLQKYNPGRSFSKEHCEHGGFEFDSIRMLGWMIYLNDIKKGGGTCWPQQRFTARPRQGDLYIWPAGWTHSHYGIVAPKETKYLVTGWGTLRTEGVAVPL